MSPRWEKSRKPRFTTNFNKWPRPGWVSEERWKKQHGEYEPLPLHQRIWVQKNAEKIMRKAFKHKNFEDLMRLVFPKNELLFHVAIWHFRDGLSLSEISRRLTLFTDNSSVGTGARGLVGRARREIERYIRIQRLVADFYEESIDEDDQIEMDIREVIRG